MRRPPARLLLGLGVRAGHPGPTETLCQAPFPGRTTKCRAYPTFESGGPAMLKKYVGCSVIGALLLTILPGTTFSQTAGVASRNLSGTAASRGAASGTTTPGLGTMPLPLPSTSPVGRATTGMIDNQQTLDRTPDQPSRPIPRHRPATRPPGRRPRSRRSADRGALPMVA